MPINQIYRAVDNDWATHMELVINEPDVGSTEYVDLETRTDHPIEFLIATVSTPEGRCPAYLDAEIEILDSNGLPFPPAAYGAVSYVASPPRLFVFNQPPGRSWSIRAKGNSVPFAVSAMAFHPSPALSTRAKRAATVAGLPLRCRLCKSTAKALALAIVAVAGAAAIPAALVAAVASFLGLALVGALAFINSVLGDAADVIAEKLCKLVGLCP